MADDIIHRDAGSGRERDSFSVRIPKVRRAAFLDIDRIAVNEVIELKGRDTRFDVRSDVVKQLGSEAAGGALSFDFFRRADMNARDLFFCHF